VVRVTNLNIRQPDGEQRFDSPEQRSGRPIGAGFTSAKLLKISGNVCFFISITLLGTNHAELAAQQVTTVAPPAARAQTPAPEGANNAAADTPDSVQDSLPNDPGTPAYPDAVPIPQPGTPLHIESQTQSTSSTGLDMLDGNVVITFRDRVLQADHIEFNADSGDVTLTGHVLITVGESDERIQASHGIVNIHTLNGRFYDVSGSVGLRQKQADGAASVTQRAVYANGNPFLFTGKLVVKTGPREFQIFNGTVTSCQLPRPDWLLSGAEFSVEGAKAYARNSVFRLMSVPVLWLPYVTHPVDASDRQTGVLIPEIGINSAAKGDTIGEQIYWAINRSTDLTVGTIYYSARGWEQTASLRYRGLGQDFVKAHYSGLHDRGYTPTGGTYINQSGTDVVFSGRHDLFADNDSATSQAVRTRMVADAEYLSSFPYREAFSSNFNQAVSSDVVSTIYATREWDGMAASLEGDRYQGEKRIATTKPPQAEEQVHIFHAPAIEFAAIDHRLGSSGFEWNLDSSVAALKRTQPNFDTSGMVERLDVHPELAYPFGGGGWRVRPAIAGRETFYSRSRLPAVPGENEVENTATLNRADVEVQFDIRPPVFERTFESGFVRNLLRHDVRHTIEPEMVYRYHHGIDNFSDVLRFDAVDVASDTNELEYGATQRLFLRRKDNRPCHAAGSSADATEILDSAGQSGDAIEDPGQATNRVDSAESVCGNREWISWHVAQKYFFDPNFGGAVVQNGPRSILETTLDFSGISFLTGPRDISPIISRLRVRTSEKTDVEWDFDFDTCSSSVTGLTNRTLPCQKKFTADNVYVDVHQGNIFSGISYARLNAPARSYVDGVLSAVADFNQMRVLFGFGRPTKQGLSAAANAGIDIDLGTVQYGAIQSSYNWNCCGISVEYRKYELGTARNDNGYKFNFTLANIGSAGNLRHSDQVF
jgi:LPS-assembly protein